MEACGFVNENRERLFTPYALRHFKISDDIMRGDDLMKVSGRAGHVKASTTSDIYAHWFKLRDAKRSASMATVLPMISGWCNVTPRRDISC